MQIRQFPRGFWPRILCRSRICIARDSLPIQASGSEGRMERLQSFNVNAPPLRKSDWPVDELWVRSVPRLQGQHPDDEGKFILFFALAAGVGTAAFAKAPRTKVAAARDVRQVTPVQLAPILDKCSGCFGCWQDLFDRNNPNNLRSDYPSPPAQPAQF